MLCLLPALGDNQVKWELGGHLSSPWPDSTMQNCKKFVSSARRPPATVWALWWMGEFAGVNRAVTAVNSNVLHAWDIGTKRLSGSRSSECHPWKALLWRAAPSPVSSLKAPVLLCVCLSLFPFQKRALESRNNIRKHAMETKTCCWGTQRKSYFLRDWEQCAVWGNDWPTYRSGIFAQESDWRHLPMVIHQLVD